jgi:polyisoprenoid-binding protein YceI
MHKKVLSHLLLGAACGLLGCSNPADNVSAAKVGTATNTTSTRSAPVAETRRFTFGPESGKIEFIGSKVTGSHHGGFKKFSGELLVASDGTLADSGSQVVIETTSLYADNDRLTGHLKSPDFFNVEKHPTAAFMATSVSQQGTNATVTGNLTLHGITKQVSFPVAVQVNSDSVKVQAGFSINRFDFEMKYPGKADDLIRKEVVLKIDVKATPATSTNRVASL